MKKESIMEFARYVLVGGISAVIDMGLNYATLYYILHSTKNGTWQVAVSVAAGFLVGLIVNFVLSNSFVFRQVEQQAKGRTFRAFLLSAMVGIVGLGLTEILTLCGTRIISKDGFMYLVLICVIKGIVLVWNYLGRKYLVYGSGRRV